MDKDNKLDKFKVNELLAEYSKTFKKPLELVTIFINRDEILQKNLLIIRIFDWQIKKI